MIDLYCAHDSVDLAGGLLGEGLDKDLGVAPTQELTDKALTLVGLVRVIKDESRDDRGRQPLGQQVQHEDLVGHQEDASFQVEIESLARRV